MPGYLHRAIDAGSGGGGPVTQNPESDVSNAAEAEQLVSEIQAPTTPIVDQIPPNAPNGSSTGIDPSDPLYEGVFDDIEDINDHGDIQTTLYGDNPPIHIPTDPLAVAEFQSNINPADTAATEAWVSAIYADPEQRARFIADMPAILDTLTPEQVATVGTLFNTQGQALASTFDNDWAAMNADADYLAMAEIHRVWGTETSRRGVDPFGNEIDIAVSSTSEDWGTHEDAVSALTSVDGVHSDMNVSPTMWTEEGNLNRYAAADEVWFIHGDPDQGTRPIGRENDGAHPRNVTMSELQVAEEARVWVPDGNGNLIMIDAASAAEMDLDLSRAVDYADLPSVFGADLDALQNPFLTYNDGQLGIDGIVSDETSTSTNWDNQSFNAQWMREQLYLSGQGNSTAVGGTFNANQLTGNASISGNNAAGQFVSGTVYGGLQNGNFAFGGEVSGGNTGSTNGGNDWAVSGGGGLQVSPDGQLVGVDGSAGLTRNGYGINIFGGYSEDNYTVYDGNTDRVGLGTNTDLQAGGGGSAPLGALTVSAQGYITRGSTVEFTTAPENIPGMEEAMAAGDTELVNQLLADSYLADRMDPGQEGYDPVRDQDFSSWNTGDAMSLTSREGGGVSGSAGAGGFSVGLGVDGLSSESVTFEMLEDNQLSVSILNMNDAAFNTTFGAGPAQLALQMATGNAVGTNFTVDLDSGAGQARMDTFQQTGLLPGALDLAMETGAIDEMDLDLDWQLYIDAANLADPDLALTEPDWSDPAFVAAVMADPDAVSALSGASSEMNAGFFANPEAMIGVEGVSYDDIVRSQTRSQSAAVSVLGLPLLSATHSETLSERYYTGEIDGEEAVETNFIHDQYDTWFLSSDRQTSRTSINAEGGPYLDTEIGRDADWDVYEQLQDERLTDGLTDVYDANGGYDGFDRVFGDPQLGFRVTLGERDVALINDVLEADPDAAERYAGWTEGAHDELQSTFLELEMGGFVTYDDQGNMVIDEVGMAEYQADFGTTFDAYGQLDNVDPWGPTAIALGSLTQSGVPPEQAEAFLLDAWDGYEGELDFDTWVLTAVVDVANADPDAMQSGGMGDLSRGIYTAAVMESYDGGILSDAPIEERFELIDAIWDFEDPSMRDGFMRQLFYEVEREQSGGEAAIEFYQFIQTLPPEVAGYLNQGANLEISSDLSGVSETIETWAAYGEAPAYNGIFLADMVVDLAEMEAPDGSQDPGLLNLLDTLDGTDITPIAAAWEASHPGMPFPYEDVGAVGLLVPSIHLYDQRQDYLDVLLSDSNDEYAAQTNALIQTHPELVLGDIRNDQDRDEWIAWLDERGFDGQALYDQAMTTRAAQDQP